MADPTQTALSSILNLLNSVYAAVGALVSTANTILNNQNGDSAQLLDIRLNTVQILANQTAIIGQLNTIQATVGTGNLQELNVLQNLLSLVGMIQQAPGPSSPSDVAQAVWQYDIPTTEREAQQLLSDAGFYAVNTGTSYIRKPTPMSVYLDIVAEWEYVLADQDGFNTPGTDSTDILPGDTLLTWLQRTTEANAGDNTPYTWQYGSPFQVDIAWTDWINIDTQPRSWLVCNLSQADFARLQAAAARPTPPVWPGLDNVTLGSPVAIVPPSQTIDVPCDGVLVALTAWPTQKPVYNYDSQEAIGFLGGITFVTDNGYAEPEQRLGFETALYCPLEMERATQVVVRSNLAVTGTITPWSLSG